MANNWTLKKSAFHCISIGQYCHLHNLIFSFQLLFPPLFPSINSFSQLNLFFKDFTRTKPFLLLWCFNTKRKVLKNHSFSHFSKFKWIWKRVLAYWGLKKTLAWMAFFNFLVADNIIRIFYMFLNSPIREEIKKLDRVKVPFLIEIKYFIGLLTFNKHHDLDHHSTPFSVVNCHFDRSDASWRISQQNREPSGHVQVSRGV